MSEVVIKVFVLQLAVLPTGEPTRCEVFRPRSTEWLGGETFEQANAVRFLRLQIIPITGDCRRCRGRAGAPLGQGRFGTSHTSHERGTGTNRFGSPQSRVPMHISSTTLTWCII